MRGTAGRLAIRGIGNQSGLGREPLVGSVPLLRRCPV